MLVSYTCYSVINALNSRLVATSYLTDYCGEEGGNISQEGREEKGRGGRRRREGGGKRRIDPGQRPQEEDAARGIEA